MNKIIWILLSCALFWIACYALGILYAVFAIICAVLAIIALSEVMYRNKIKRRITQLEDAQRYGKPNWTKWWDR